MELPQIVLMIAGLGVAGGGTALLFKDAGRGRGRTGRDEAPGDVSRPRPGVYLPLAMVLAGAVITYRAISHYRADDPADVTTMFAFAFALIFLLGLRLLVVDRYRYGYGQEQGQGHGHGHDAQPAQPARPHQKPPDEADDARDPDQSSAPPVELNTALCARGRGSAGGEESTDDIDTIFLCQGCQQAESVARRMAAFIRTATRSIDIAIYSFSLCPETRQIVLDALRERADAGVSIRIAYDANTQQDMIEEAGNDICDIETSTFVRSLGFPSRAIEGYRALMHHKYIVVDAGTPQAAVWTGSANFTDDSWRLQENNILILRSQDIAAAYEHDFYELWVDGNLAPSGEQDSGEGTLRYGGQPAYVQVNFSPGMGEWIDDAITRQIERTTERATLAFAVLTSGDILHALLDLMARNVPIEGIYDRTQMREVIEQWRMVPANHWKIPAFEQLVRYGRLAGKDSTQYSDNSPHDFMHNKVMVLDDVVITGSYNFSRHAQQNAENCLLIHSAPLSTTYRRYIRQIMARYAG